MRLIVNGMERDLGADWVIRFVEEDPVTPVLYYKGKRVTKSWSIELIHDSAGDSHENANTADI